MIADDPWTGLEPPTSAEIINAKRVDGKHPWNFFWARSVDRKCLLILQCSAACAPKGKLPKLKGIEVALSEPETGSSVMVSLKLTDNQHRDIFHRLVLERYLIPLFGPADATSAWVGPTGSPKDFECGRTAIEAKARRGAARPYVAISSEYQLDASGCDALFVYVVELDSAPEDAASAFTVTDVACRIVDRIAAEAPAVLERFEGQLVASGFSRDDDYSSFRWISGPHRFLHVVEDFPRITPAVFKSGVERVRFDLSLVECEQFRVDDDFVRGVLKGGGQ
jgi:hypothetical protein